MGYIRVYPSFPLRYIFWEAVEGADSYVLKIGTSTGESNVFDSNIGNEVSYSIRLAPGTYYANVVPYTGATPLTPLGEESFTIT